MTNVVAFAVANGARHPHTNPPHTVDLSDPEHFKDLVRAAIRESGLKYKVIAARSRITPGTIGKLAYGETSRPQLRTVIAVLVALGYRFTAHKD